MGPQPGDVEPTYASETKATVMQRLVLLHGWGANADDLRPLGDMLQQGHPQPIDVVALDAPEAHPQPPGRQWYGLFPAQWQDVPSAVDALKTRLLELEGGEQALASTVLFGFSQGGAMALEVGCSLHLAGVISCSGYPHPEWTPPSRHPPVLLLHGEQDTIVPVAAMDAIWQRLNPDLCQQYRFNNGHTIPEEVMAHLRDALLQMQGSG